MTMTVRVRRDHDGMYVRITGLAAFPADTTWAVWLMDRNRCVRAASRTYADADGDFVTQLAVDGDRGRTFLPEHAWERRAGLTHPHLRVARLMPAGAGMQVAEFTDFSLPWPAGASDAGAVLRPLAGLFASIAHADGRPTPAQQAALRSAMLDLALEDLSPSDRERLGELATRPPPDDPLLFWRVVRSRFPLLPADVLLGMLTEVAAHLSPGPAGRAHLEGIAKAAGLPPPTLPAPVGSPREDEELLGLDADWTPADLKRAWRQRASEYHPDRYTSSPAEIRRFSEQHFRRLRSAYERLRDTGPGGGRVPVGDAERLGWEAYGVVRSSSWTSLQPPVQGGGTGLSVPRETKPVRGPGGTESVRQPSSAQATSTVGVFGVDDDTRNGMGIAGAVVGFLLGLPAGGIGALPGALIGYVLGAFLPEVGCALLVGLGGLMALILMVLSNL